MAKQPKGKSQVEEEVLDAEQDIQESGPVGIVEWIEQNSRLLLIVGGVVLLVVGGFAFFRYQQNSQDLEAQAEMFQAVKYFEADSLDKALNGDGTFLGLLDISDSYSGTSAANMADYYIGIAYLRQGSTEDGIDYLERVSNDDNLLTMGKYAALGFAYEERGDAAKAGSYFEKAAVTPEENPQTTPTMWLRAGINYEEAGDASKARKLYEKIKEEYPSSSEGIKIDKYLARVYE